MSDLKPSAPEKSAYELAREEMIADLERGFAYASGNLCAMADPSYLYHLVPKEERIEHLKSIHSALTTHWSKGGVVFSHVSQLFGSHLEKSTNLLTREESTSLIKAAHSEFITMLENSNNRVTQYELCELLSSQVMDVFHVLAPEEHKECLNKTQATFLNIMTESADKMIDFGHNDYLDVHDPIDFLQPFVEKAMKFYPVEEQFKFVTMAQDAMVEIVLHAKKSRASVHALNALTGISSSKKILDNMPIQESSAVVMKTVDTLTQCIAEDEFENDRFGYLDDLVDFSTNESVLVCISKQQIADILTHVTEMVVAEHSKAEKDKVDFADMLVEMVYDDDVHNALDEVQYGEFARKALGFLIEMGAKAEEGNDSYKKLVNECIACDHVIPFLDKDIMEESGYADIRGQSNEDLEARLDVMDLFLANKDEKVKTLYIEDYKLYADQLYGRFLASATDLESFDMQENASIPQDYQKITTFIQKYQNNG